MWYSNLITDKELEIPLYLERLNTKYEFESDYLSTYIYGKKWNYLKELFLSNNISTKKQTLLGFTIIVGKGLLILEEDEQYKILILQTSKALYVDKELPNTYRKLYLKFKNEIEVIYNSEVDVIYTNNCGKNSFYQFEMPKFKSISDRNEYVGQLLDEYYDNR